MLSINWSHITPLIQLVDWLFFDTNLGSSSAISWHKHFLFPSNTLTVLWKLKCTVVFSYMHNCPMLWCLYNIYSWYIKCISWYRSQLSHNGTMSKKDIIKTDIQTPDGIAIDWIHDLLYWTDTGFNNIQVASLEGDKKATIISSDLDEPRGITLDPTNGYVDVFFIPLLTKLQRK